MHFRSFVVIVITCVCVLPSSTLRMKRQPESSTVAPGESVTLRCSISRPFAVDVFWKRVDKMLYLSRNTFVEPQEGLNVTSWKERYTIVGNQNKGQYFLQIDNFMIDDVGSYACEYYSSGSVKSRVADLRIATPPDAMYPICSISPRGPHSVGDVITLSCDSIGGDPPASLAFRRGSETLRIYLPFSGHPHSLVTHTFILEERDVNRRYTCVLRHSALANPRACSLMPLRTRVGAYLRPLVGKVMEGENVTFTCVAERLPDLQFNWFVDGELVDGTDRFRQVDSSGQRLLISNTGMDLDYSLITCEVIQIGPGHMGVATSLISVAKRPPTTTVPTTIHQSRGNNGNRALDTDVDSGDYVGSGGLASDSAILPSDTDNLFHEATDSHVTTQASAPGDVVTPNVTGSYSTDSSVSEDASSVQSDIVKDKSQDVTMDNQLSGNNKTNEEKPISHAQLDFNEVILPEEVADQNTATNPPVTTETGNKVFESSSEGSSLRDSVSSNKPYLEVTDFSPLVKSTEETLESATTDRTIRESTTITSKSSPSPSSSSISSSSTSNDVVTQRDSTKSYQSTRRPSKEMTIVFNVTIVKPINETSTSTKPSPKVQQGQSSTTTVIPSVKHAKEQTSTVSVTPSVTSGKERRSTTTLTPTVTNYKRQRTTNDLSSSFENEKEKQTTTEVTPSITSDKRRPSTTVMTPSMKQEKEQYTTTVVTPSITSDVKQSSTTVVTPSMTKEQHTTKAVVTPSVTSSTETRTTTTMSQSVTSDKEQTSITVTTPSLASEKEQTVSPEAKDSGKQDPTVILTSTLKSESDRSPTTTFSTTNELIESSTTSTRNVPNEVSTVNTEVTSTPTPRRPTTGSLTTEPTGDGTSKVIERTTVGATTGPHTTYFEYQNDRITSTTQTTQRRQNTLKLSTESENNVTLIPATHKTTVKSHEMHDETTSNNPERMTPVVDITSKATSDFGSDDQKTSGYDSTLMTSTFSVEASVKTSTKATAVVADSNENATTVGSSVNDTFDISDRNNDSELEVPNDTNIGKNPNIFINLSESHSSVRYMDDRIWHYIIIGTAVIVVCIVAAVVVSAIVVSKRKGKT